MSARGASAAVLTEWAKASNIPAHLVQVQLDSGDGGTVYMTNFHRAVSWGGNSYVAGGHLLGFSGLAESADLRVRDVQVSLAGVDQVWVANILLKQYFKRPLLIYQALFDQTTDAVIVDPVLIHSGYMEDPRSEEDPVAGTHTVTIVSRDQFSDFERLTGRHTNSNDQKLYFAGDTSFDLWAQLALQQRQFIWGATSQAGSGVGVGVGGGTVTVTLGGATSGGRTFGSRQ